MQLELQKSFAPSVGQPFSSTAHGFVPLERHVVDRQNAEASRAAPSNPTIPMTVASVLLMASPHPLHASCPCATRCVVRNSSWLGAIPGGDLLRQRVMRDPPAGV